MTTWWTVTYEHWYDQFPSTGEISDGSARGNKTFRRYRITPVQFPVSDLHTRILKIYLPINISIYSIILANYAIHSIQYLSTFQFSHIGSNNKMKQSSGIQFIGSTKWIRIYKWDISCAGSFYWAAAILGHWHSNWWWGYVSPLEGTY